MSVSREPNGRDRLGQVLVLVCLNLVVLMIFTAFVIDVGSMYLERRQDVAAADSAVTAGAARLIIRTTASKDVVGRDAVAMARVNLRVPPSVGRWNDLFAGCTDPNRNLTEYPDGDNYRPTLSDGRPTDCVHFNVTFTRIRVRIPDQVVPTTFARVVGVNSLQTFAESEARITPGWIGAKGIPLAINPSQGTPTDLLCIRRDRACSGPTNQATRILDAPLFANPQSCGSMFHPPQPGDATPNLDPTLGDRVAENAAIGLDHTVVVWDGVAADRRGDDCGPLGAPRAPTPMPNWLFAHEYDNLAGRAPAAVQQFIGGFADGLVFGKGGAAFRAGDPRPRLERYPAGWTQTRSLTDGAGSYVVDDRPLWDYIGTGRLPTSCGRGSFDLSNPSDPNNTGPTIGHMVRCLRDWNSSFDAIFTADSDNDGKPDIQFSPRAGIVPLVGGCPNNCGDYPPVPITGFQVAFIQTLYMSSDPAGSCPCTEYNPGVDLTGRVLDNGPIDVTGMEPVGIAVFRIFDGMLPDSARPEPEGGFPGGSGISITH